MSDGRARVAGGRGLPGRLHLQVEGRKTGKTKNNRFGITIFTLTGKTKKHICLATLLNITIIIIILIAIIM